MHALALSPHSLTRPLTSPHPTTHRGLVPPQLGVDLGIPVQQLLHHRHVALHASIPAPRGMGILHLTHKRNGVICAQDSLECKSVVRTFIHARTPGDTHRDTYIQTCILIHTLRCTHIYIHTYINSYIHTHTPQSLKHRGSFVGKKLQHTPGVICLGRKILG